MNNKQTIKRKILQGIGALSLSATLGLSPSTYASSDEKNTSNSLDGIVNVQDREKLVQQAYEKMQTTFGTPPQDLVNSFSYDSNNEVMKRLNENIYVTASKDPRFIKIVVDDQVKNNPAVKQGKLTEASILAYFATPEGQKILQTNFAPLMINSTATAETTGTQVQYPFDFGSGEKSDIVFFPAAFETVTVDTKKGDYQIKPTLESLELLARHELHHAQIAKDGFKINGIDINSSKYMAVDKGVLRFVIESNVLLADLEYAKRFENKSRQKHSDEYILTLLQLGSAAINGKNAAEKKNLDFESKRIYESHMGKIAKDIEFAYRTLVEAGWKGAKTNYTTASNK